MTDQQRAGGRSGLFYGVAAYGLWGLMPLYFVTVRAVHPLELLAQRTVWSALLLFVVLTLLGRWGELRRCLAVPRTRWLLLASTLLLAVNWFVFLYAVWSEQTIQNSLGYFINPLFSIVLGVVCFRERLRPAQWVGLALASAGLLYMIVALGQVPWIAFALAGAFGLYGLLRKIAPVDGLIGLSIESMFLLPAALAFLVGWALWGALAFGQLNRQIDVLLLFSGAATAIPLICFGQAARKLPLSTLGFLQYLAPSLQFVFAVTLLEEKWWPAQQVGFGCIWAALGLVSIDSVLAQRQHSAARNKEARAAQERALAPATGAGLRPVR